MIKIFIVSDNNQTDGECGYIIGLSHEYETAVRLKREYIEKYAEYDKQENARFSCFNGKFQSYTCKYPHNIEIMEKEIV